MLYRLPPVGRRVALREDSVWRETINRSLKPYRAEFFATGTMALASAFVAAKRLTGRAPAEVVVPAYTCPDVISAIVFAGATPVLVDVEEGTPWLDLEKLKSRITRNTVAVVAVHFLGIPERTVEIQTIARDGGIIFIEDSAQAFPGPGSEAPWRGDFVVLSFGRGKPIALLEGGAVLSVSADLAAALPGGTNVPGSLKWPRLALSRAKALLYNVFLAPRLYWMVSRVPFLRLGETRYRPLKTLESVPSGFPSRVAANLPQYWQNGSSVEEWISAMVQTLDEGRLVDIAETCERARWSRLLRYPLRTSDRGSRERLFEHLDRCGLGVSKMYPSPLTGIPGLEDMLKSLGPFPAAERFADTILTLPTHPGVRKEDVLRMEKEIRVVFGSGA